MKFTTCTREMWKIYHVVVLSACFVFTARLHYVVFEKLAQACLCCAVHTSAARSVNAVVISSFLCCKRSPPVLRVRFTAYLSVIFLWLNSVFDDVL